jgi:hypothetical protein
MDIGGLMKLVKEKYYHWNWDSSKWNVSTASKTQQLLCRDIKAIMPDLDVEYNHSIPMITYEEVPSKGVQIDVWIPKLNLGLEYQVIICFLST